MYFFAFYNYNIHHHSEMWPQVYPFHIKKKNPSCKKCACLFDTIFFAYNPKSKHNFLFLLLFLLCRLHLQEYWGIYNDHDHVVSQWRLIESTLGSYTITILYIFILYYSICNDTWIGKKIDYKYVFKLFILILY
jgi:hypothetical protein